MFCYTSQLKIKTAKNRLPNACELIALPRFQGARPDHHVRVESSYCCFPRELVSFVRRRELASFDARHLTRIPPIGKRIRVGRYTKEFDILTRRNARLFTALRGEYNISELCY